VKRISPAGWASQRQSLHNKIARVIREHHYRSIIVHNIKHKEALTLIRRGVLHPLKYTEG
jgi:hypothetical protein